jgi:ubiquitin-conjugating enzyme E2 O
MGTYRLEAASTGRAGCQNKECKEEKIKIGKGELRLGTWVDTEKFQSFFWRHWGCVTPKIIANLNEAVEEAGGDSKDLDAIDGFEELPSGYQEKVRKALEQGHVDDEDWKGDPEMNRPGMAGFRKRAPKKKKADEEEAETASEKEEKTPKSKKRGRAQTEKDKPEEKATAPKAKRAKKGSRVKQESDTEDDDGDQHQESDEEEVQPNPTVTRRGRVSKAAAEEKAPKVSAKPAAKRQRKSMGEDGEEVEPVEEKPKRGRRKKST